MRNFVRKAAAAACVLSTAVMCTMTSALAEVEYADGKVKIPVEDTSDIFTTDRIEAQTQMTTMIVSKAKWDAITTEELTADDIYYINQDEAEALQALLAGTAGTTVGVKGGTLAYGTYVALIGGEDVEASDIKAIEFSVKSGSEQVPITSITVGDLQLKPGEKKTLVVTPNPEATEVGEYTFAVEGENAGVINLNAETGEVEALTPGDVKVKVTLKSNPAVSAVANVSVVDDGEQISVSVDPATKTLAVDETVQLTAKVTPETAGQGVTWSVTSGEDVVKVTEEGLVTALKEGSATVTATSVEDPTKSASCVITVSNGGGDEYDPENYGKTWAYLGDVNLDGRTRVNDLTAVQRHLLNIDGFVLTEGALDYKAADINSDERLRVNDLTALQRHLLNMDGFILTQDDKVKID